MLYNCKNCGELLRNVDVNFSERLYGKKTPNNCTCSKCLTQGLPVHDLELSKREKWERFRVFSMPMLCAIFLVFAIFFFIKTIDENIEWGIPILIISVLSLVISMIQFLAYWCDCSILLAIGRFFLLYIALGAIVFITIAVVIVGIPYWAITEIERIKRIKKACTPEFIKAYKQSLRTKRLVLNYKRVIKYERGINSYDASFNAKQKKYDNECQIIRIKYAYLGDAEVNKRIAALKAPVYNPPKLVLRERVNGYVAEVVQYTNVLNAEFIYTDKQGVKHTVVTKDGYILYDDNNP